MSDTSILVENLGKVYKIGARLERYKMLREVMAGSVSASFRAIRSRFSRSNAQLSNGDNFIWALREVSFRIKKGEVVGIIGRNGAGKSTLLKVLSRITDPTEGRAEIYGRVGSLLEVGTGFHLELTGRENIYLNGAILGMRKSEIARKFDAIVDFAEVERFIDTPVKHYSSGMYLRLAFAVAAHLDPEILMVDEVLAVGDAAFQKKCLGKMGEVAKEGRTVLFVSHNMGAISNLCQRTIYLEEGRVALDADTGKVISRYLNQNLIERPIVSACEIEDRVEGVIRKNDPFIRFREIAILDLTGAPRDVFHSDEKIFVSVLFECFKPVRDLRVEVYVVDENGVPFLGSENVDDPSVVERFGRLETGSYRATCVFPENIFGERQFFLTVHLLSIKNEDLRLPKILSFEVKFKGYNNVQDTSLRKVFVRPQMNWQMQRVDAREAEPYVR